MTDTDTAALDRVLDEVRRLVRRLKDMPIMLQYLMNRLADDPGLGFDIVDGRACPSDRLHEFVAELRACKN